MLPVYSRRCEVDTAAYLAYLESYNGAVAIVSDGLARGGSGQEIIKEISTRCGYSPEWFDAVDGQDYRYRSDIVGDGVAVGADLRSGDRSFRMAIGDGVAHCADCVRNGGGDDSGTRGGSRNRCDNWRCRVVGSDKGGDDYRRDATRERFRRVSSEKLPILAGGVDDRKGPDGDVGARTLLNRKLRQKAKARKARKKIAQGFGVDPKTRVQQSGSGGSKGFFSSCAEDVRKQLVETRALRLTVENKLRVAEMEQKMQVMRLEGESRLIERKFENDRMKVEIEAKKRIGEMPGGTVETVVSSGSVSPNSSISLAAENRLRKDLADANEKLAKLGGSVTGESVLSETERELRLANFELGSIGLRNRAFGDVTFTDCDYKIALQALRDEYADVLLSGEMRAERKAVEKVLEVLAGKVNDDDLEEIAKLGYIDADTLIY